MLYREIGNTGVRASILGYGCMRFPVIDGKNNCIDKEKATELLRHAYDLGINYFDTAYVYHGETSEQMVGEALHDVRDKVIFTTKLWPPKAETADDMDRMLDTQLKRLNTSYLDFYFLHSLHKASWTALKTAGALEFLDKAKADGRIRHAGFSFHDEKDIFKEILNSYDWELVQLQHNFLQRDYQAGEEGIAMAAERNIGISIMEPLHGGDLARENPLLTPVWAKSSYKRTPVAWAFRYLWSRGEFNLLLSGMSDMQQIDENAALADDPAMIEALEDNEAAILNEAAAVLSNSNEIPCTRCSYCMPCPFDVNIPGNFATYNEAVTFNNAERGKLRYAGMKEKGTAAAACQKCGACLEKCPQHIDIPGKLEKVVSILGK